MQPGLPSELLLRNPAIAQAEAQLYAAHANVDAARTLYFPSLNLSGGAGYGSSSLSNLFGPAGFIWNIGASVGQTIFDGGRIHAQNDQAKALQLELIANYRKTVFTGFQDVETSLDQVKAFTDQLALIEVQTRASAEAFRISELQYREGTIDIVQLLQNQENLFSAQQALVQTKLSRLESYICALQCAGRRLGAEGGRCELQEPARLVAAVTSAISTKGKGRLAAPFCFHILVIPGAAQRETVRC